MMTYGAIPCIAVVRQGRVLACGLWHVLDGERKMIAKSPAAVD